MLGDLANEFHVGMGLHHRAYFFIPIGLINAVYFCRHLERHSCFSRNFAQRSALNVAKLPELLQRR